MRSSQNPGQRHDRRDRKWLQRKRACLREWQITDRVAGLATAYS